MNFTDTFDKLDSIKNTIKTNYLESKFEDNDKVMEDLEETIMRLTFRYKQIRKMYKGYTPIKCVECLQDRQRNQYYSNGAHGDKICFICKKKLKENKKKEKEKPKAEPKPSKKKKVVGKKIKKPPQKKIVSVSDKLDSINDWYDLLQYLAEDQAYKTFNHKKYEIFEDIIKIFHLQDDYNTWDHIFEDLQHHKIDKPKYFKRLINIFKKHI